MRKSFGARRVPRKVGQDDDDDAGASSSGAESVQTTDPVVKRPPIASKSKKRSSLRLSFGPGESGTEGEEDGGAVFTPKKSNLSRIAAERNAERKGLRVSLASDQLPSRREVSEERPSYSKEALAELRGSTPTTPKDLGPSAGEGGDEAADSKDVDIAAKFGPLSSLKSYTSSAIPTEAEIQEKKERRARLAQEPNFMSLDDDDNNFNNDSTYDSDDLDRPRDIAIRSSAIKEKYPESRLVHEDEDIAEGFEQFVEDGKISLGRKAEREAERKRREEMASLIAQAEGGSGDDGSDDSEAERTAAYEAAQTRAGTYGSRDKAEADAQRPRTPPKISPLPELGGVLARLRIALKEQEEVKKAKVRRMEELLAEKADIASREVWIQSQLKEAGERYEKLRIEAGIGGGANTPVNGMDGSAGGSDRGLDSLGTTPRAEMSNGDD